MDYENSEFALVVNAIRTDLSFPDSFFRPAPGIPPNRRCGSEILILQRLAGETKKNVSISPIENFYRLARCIKKREEVFENLRFGRNCIFRSSAGRGRRSRSGLSHQLKIFIRSVFRGVRKTMHSA
jgi:hypothetical protein